MFQVLKILVKKYTSNQVLFEPVFKMHIKKVKNLPHPITSDFEIFQFKSIPEVDFLNLSISFLT